MAQEVSCKIIRTVLDYAESHGGAEAIDQIVAAAHLPLATLRDENAWIDHDTEKRIFRVLDEIVGMKNAAYHCGEYGVRHKSFGALDTFMRALMRPKNVYSRVPYLANRLAKVGTMEIEKLGPSSAQVTYRYHDDYDSIVEICENRRGMLASVPTLWGLPPATVEETECSARGAAVCNYQIRWVEPLGDPMRLKCTLWGAAAGSLAVGAAALGWVELGVLEGAAFACVLCAAGWVIGHALNQTLDMKATRELITAQNDELSTQLVELEKRFAELETLNLHLEDEVAKRTAELEVQLWRHKRLNELSRDIGTTLASDEILDLAFSGLNELVGAKGCMILPAKTRFDFAAGDSSSPVPSRSDVDESYVAEVERELAELLKRRESQRVTDLVTAHLLLLPLSAADDVVGALAVLRPADLGDFGASDIELCRTLAEVVASALTNALLLEKTDSMSITDALTNLYVQRYFREALHTEVQRVKRYGHAFAVLLLGIDNFEEVTAIHGHQVGDAVLRDVASELKQRLRSVDVPCRYGGAEFALLLPHTDKLNAQATADRLRTELSGNNIHARGDRKQVTLHVTVSIGATIYEPGLDANATVRRAQDALLEAKEAGNCVRFARAPD